MYKARIFWMSHNIILKDIYVDMQQWNINKTKCLGKSNRHKNNFRSIIIIIWLFREKMMQIIFYVTGNSSLKVWFKFNKDILYFKRASWDKSYVAYGFENIEKIFCKYIFFLFCWSILVYIKLKNCFYVTTYLCWSDLFCTLCYLRTCLDEAKVVKLSHLSWNLYSQNK